MCGRQIEQRERAAPERFDLSKRFFLMPVANPAGGTDPDRAGLLHDRQQRSRESTRHGLVTFAPRNTI
jgi:hypothetical protein